MTTTISVFLAIADEQKLSGDAFPRALSALKVKNARSLTRPQKISDGGGLTLYVPASGGKSWRYRFRLDGREQTLTLGGYPEISLDTARTAHRAARWLVERGVSPISYAQDEIDRAKAEDLAETTGSFGAVATRWMAATAQAVSASTAKQIAAMLRKHVLPKLQEQPIAEVSRRSLVELLSAIDQSAPETAKRCRIYIKQIFDYALDFELVRGNPTPSAKILVNHSSRRVVPRKALPLSQLGGGSQDPARSDQHRPQDQGRLDTSDSYVDKNVGSYWGSLRRV